MASRGESWRFWVPVVLLGLFYAYVAQKLARTHLDAEVSAPRYEFKRSIPGRRGSIYASGLATCPLVKSVPIWEYHLDPVALTNAIVRKKGEPPRRPKAILRTVADALSLDYRKLLAMSADTRRRYQFLAQSNDPDAHRLLADSHLVAGVVIEDRQIRQYIQERHMAHVLGSVNQVGEPSAGIELKFDKELAGVPGMIRGKRDAHGNELYDKRIEEVAPIPGSDIYLTIDNNLQYEVETALADGIAEFKAASGWCVVLDSATGAVLAMASYPDFHPSAYGRATDMEKINRVVNFTYEPGSVMKTITAAAALNDGFVRPDSLFSTDRGEEGYYKLPGDGSHVWEPKMTVREAIAHSSNIVIGKLGYNFGPEKLWRYMRRFGFGAKTGIDLPGEEAGILRNWKKWDKATWSRAPIGQAVSVTAIQLASAYQAIANDGHRMKPHVVEKIVGPDGKEKFRAKKESLGRPIGVKASREIREMMLGVASREGTARRAAIRGYSIAGKTGTAQKVRNGRYADGLYRATFCGIVPSGVVSPSGPGGECAPPRFVALVTLDFETREKFHQGGNSAAPIFRRIATQTLRYLGVEPDKPWELVEEAKGDDEFDRMMDDRAGVERRQ